MPTNKLKMNLQHFAEGGQEDPPAKADEKKDPEQKQEEKPETMIPKTRFDEVNQKMKDMEAKVQAFEQAQADAEKAAQEEQGEYEKLYRAKEQEVEQLTSYKTRAEQLEGAFGEMVNAKVESIPEDYRELIPEGMTAEQKLEWITKAESKGMFKTVDTTQKEIGGGKGGTNPEEAKVDLSKMTPLQRMLSGYGKKKK
ncbi:hypothetical protein [Alkalicoccobacillus gibsonii]|uniref:hypothetical protein n=1 Tax=Alkalicoccobacillus gibsonii TaxID=79881 RepID=UPI003519443E